VETDVEFHAHDLRNPIPYEAKFGYCTDVLEHIAPEDVDTVLKNVLTAAKKVFFQISTVPDHFGQMVGEVLHLTVEPYEWWLKKLEDEHCCRILWSERQDNAALFYVTAYANAQDFQDRSSLNITEEQAKANIIANLRLGLKDVVPHQKQLDTIYLLGGGPSLNEFEAQIVEEGKKGRLIVCTNGTYNWLLERGVKPAAQIMVDGRKFNRRFVEPVVDSCKYLMCSQVDNEIVASLPKDQTWLWHSGESKLVKDVVEEYAKEVGSDLQWFPVHGGSTVMLRAITLLAMLGFRNIEIFGWDSCLSDDKHHAYSQPENDSKAVIEIEVEGRKFKCHGWMAVQANEVAKCVRYIWAHVEDLNLQVHGDGLISHIFNSAAQKESLNGSNCMASL
jgi:uncharacterized Rossmann fold enzyme